MILLGSLNRRASYNCSEPGTDFDCSLDGIVHLPKDFVQGLHRLRVLHIQIVGIGNVKLTKESEARSPKDRKPAWIVRTPTNCLNTMVFITKHKKGLIRRRKIALQLSSMSHEVQRWESPQPAQTEESWKHKRCAYLSARCSNHWNRSKTNHQATSLVFLPLLPTAF